MNTFRRNVPKVLLVLGSSHAAADLRGTFEEPCTMGLQLRRPCVHLIRFKGFIKFRATKNASIFHFFSSAMLEAVLNRTETLPRRSWDAPRILQDAPRRLLGSFSWVTWKLLDPSWAPRQPQDAPKTQDPQKKRTQMVKNRVLCSRATLERPRALQGAPAGVGLSGPGSRAQGRARWRTRRSAALWIVTIMTEPL